MSVHITCDRCGKPTRGYFVNAEIKVKRGAFASIISQISPASTAHNWGKDWQLCEDCCASLKRWTNPDTRVVYETGKP